MNLQERIDSYSSKFPKFQPLYIANEKRIEGLWLLGNQYQTSGYYGAYPHGYLDRIEAIFPELKSDETGIMHLFSGSLGENRKGIKIDINPEKSDRPCDAHKLSEYFDVNSLDFVLADPPYSIEDAEHYGTPMVKRQVVFKEAIKVLRPGGHLIWLDQVLPNHSKDVVNWMLAIGIVKSTNHRVRAVFGFEKI